ncbi:rod shape-determining protein MreD [Nocardioides plantarum]|uniref:Rod shape-determining protein MreD n=1 Tax=Nocardioides plantarum TaxID=29299 RepID=A0ABV5KCY4_9ACTN|nr:rod shape-determining protein MreD [Nocardioides plantarum]
MTSSRAVRTVLLALAAVVALVLQTSVFPHFAWRGVGPDVVLLVVVAGGLLRGPQVGLVLGFGAGLLLDLAPPADHVAGRWALALLLVGYVAGRVRQDAPAGLGATLAAVAACSFLGTSVFALTGLLLQDRSATVPDLLEVVLTGVAWDLALTAVVLAVVALARARLEPDGVPAR